MRKALCCAWLLLVGISGGCASSRPSAATKHDESQRLVKQAHQAEDRGDQKAAEILLTEAVSHSPGNCEMRLELSELLVQHGSMEAAADHLAKLVAQNPDDPRGYVRLAQVRYQQNQYAEASKLLDRALEMDPQHTQGLLLHGKLEELQRRDESALEAYHRAMMCESEQVEAELRIAAIHLRRGNSQQAAPMLRSVLESSRACSEQKADASWMLGNAYAREDRWIDAASALNASLRNRKMSTQDWQQVAYARFRAGDLPGAFAANETVLGMDPQSTAAITLKSTLLAAAQGNRQTAPDAAIQQAQGSAPERALNASSPDNPAWVAGPPMTGGDQTLPR